MGPEHRNGILQAALLSVLSMLTIHYPSLKFMSAITQLQIIPQIKAELCPCIKLELHEIKAPF